MRLLVLGGTRFVGRAAVTAALGHGWEVATFNRGRSGPDVPGAHALRGDRTRAADLATLVAAGPWDAVVDTSGYVPRNVLAACKRLEPVAGRYIFMSTVSVYRGWPAEPLTEASEVLYCPPDVGPEYGEDTEDGPTKYGYQKSGCELAVTTTFGGARSTLLRPGVVLGPREYVGRLPWWLSRVVAGGRVLAPGSPDRSIQPVDVRDLAEFAIRSAAQGISGAFNMTAPIGRETFGGMLDACAQVTRSGAQFVWVLTTSCLPTASGSGRRCLFGGPSRGCGGWTPQRLTPRGSRAARWRRQLRTRGRGCRKVMLRAPMSVLARSASAGNANRGSCWARIHDRGGDLLHLVAA